MTQISLNLAAVLGENKYCGPSALATICGITTDEAEKVIQSVLGNSKPVKGLWESDLKDAFRFFGYHTMKVNLPAGMSLFSAMFRMGNNIGTYVFNIPHHYVVIEITANDRFICDNHTKSPLNLASSARLNQRVLSVFKVVKK